MPPMHAWVTCGGGGDGGDGGGGDGGGGTNLFLFYTTKNVSSPPSPLSSFLFLI